LTIGERSKEVGSFVLDVRESVTAQQKATSSGRWRFWLTQQERSARWAARLVFLLGLVSVISALFPPWRQRLHLLTEVLPPLAPAIASAITVPLGLILIWLSSGLRRRKHRAWQVAVGVSATLVVLHVIKGLDLEEALFSVTVLGLLLLARQAFSGAPDPRSHRQFGLALLVGSVSSSVVGIALITADPDNVVGTPSPWQVLEQVWFGLVGVPGPLTFDSSTTESRVATSLFLLGCLVAVAVLTVAFRPAGGPHRLTEPEAIRVRDLLTLHGGQDSLGYFALRDDKSVIFSPTGKAAIAYRVIGGVSLASGDPLGDPEAWPGAIAAWLEETRRYAWVPAVLGASERGAEVYERSGLDALELGDEAVVEVADFTLTGRAMRGVRQAEARLRRKGYSTEVFRLRDAAPEKLATLVGLGERWRDGQVERGFSMALGRFGDGRDRDVVVATCTDSEGVPRGLLGFVPWGLDGLSLDLMRRCDEADNGVIELMVTALLAQAPTLGIRRVSLNFAVFRAVFERGGRLGAGPVLRIWHRILLVASKFWQIESLYRANAKYQPVWEPRFLCFVRARDLPRIGAAALEAEAFIRRPRWLGGCCR
jgi:lysyl-tRNA synthetase class 2